MLGLDFGPTRTVRLEMGVVLRHKVGGNLLQSERKLIQHYIQFSLVQSLSRVRLFVTA